MIKRARIAITVEVWTDVDVDHPGEIKGAARMAARLYTEGLSKEIDRLTFSDDEWHVELTEVGEA